MATILIVDDDEIVCDVIAAMLQRQGHQALVHLDGSRVLKAIEVDNVDLVITDIIMPNTEGIETIIQIRRAHPALPVIAMSSSDRYLKFSETFGADRAFVKPIDLGELAAAVQALLAPAAKKIAS